MLVTILNWLSGGVVTKLAEAYFRSVERKANSENERERIKAQAELGRIEAKSKTVQVAMAYRAFWFVWLLFTIPLGLWWGKIIIVDKLCACGVTEPLTGQIALWAEMIVHSVFPSGAAVGMSAAIAAAILGRK
ncbi:MAG: hypothetical protein A49_08190 [Methyloceanibacter sp.]|nr:MAG: hypothetical protein A49_08190 [Methyloceanibacter sp.]